MQYQVQIHVWYAGATFSWNPSKSSYAQIEDGDKSVDEIEDIDTEERDDVLQKLDEDKAKKNLQYKRSFFVRMVSDPKIYNPKIVKNEGSEGMEGTGVIAPRNPWVEYWISIIPGVLKSGAFLFSKSNPYPRRYIPYMYSMFKS